MVFPGDNQPPSDPFAPGQPPGPFGPGPINPGYVGPSSFQPAPSSGNDVWKYLLIGCAAIVLLGGIITIGSCVFLASKGSSAMPKLLRFVKSEYVKDLTADHTPEQRARFESAYDFYVDQAEKLGFMEWAGKYTDAIDRLGVIDQDKQITVEESQAWADMVLDGTGTDDSGGTGADDSSGTGTDGTEPESGEGQE